MLVGVLPMDKEGAYRNKMSFPMATGKYETASTNCGRSKDVSRLEPWLSANVFLGAGVGYYLINAGSCSSSRPVAVAVK